MSQNQTYPRKKPSTSPDSSPADQSDAVAQLDASDTGELDHEFRCPHCEATYQHELITRVHITRAEDDAHRHHNGLMPEAEIEVVNDDGAVVETVSRRPEEMETTTLSVDDYPSDLTAANRHVLMEAAHHPEATKTTIADKIEERLADSDVNAPVYSTVCDMLNQFYRPHGGKDSTNLADLTTKQQAILIARLAAPDASYTRIAEMVGTAHSYPRQVLKQHPQVIGQLNTVQDTHDDLTAAIQSELSDEDLGALISDGLLARVPIEFEDISITADPTDDSQEDTSDESSTTDAKWGSPVDQPTGLRAAPSDPIESADDSTDEDQPAPEQTELSQTDAQQNGDADTGSDGTTEVAEADGDPARPEHVPRADIEQLQAKVVFLKETFAGQSDSDGSLVMSVAEQIEQECEAMLDSRTHS